MVSGAADGVARIAELEAWGAAGSGVGDVRWLVSDQLGTPRMIVDKAGSLAGIRRHDYLPFGEEISSDASWRTAARGYAGDSVRQKFTGKEQDEAARIGGYKMSPEAEDVLVSWSGGKDGCLALYELRQAGAHRVAALLTTVTRDYDRVQMHGVRRVLLERQAESLGLPLRQVLIPKGATNEEYERATAEALSEYRERGVETVVFGDLFLEDVRAYRERFLARHGMRGLYPVWMRDTREFVGKFIALGFKAVVTCVNPEALDGSFAGRLIDEEFLASLPPRVDPCGENGEFHTFVFDGPSFKEGLKFAVGERVFRDSFWFCELTPV